MLGKVSVPGRPTDLDNSRARSAAPEVGAGWVFSNILSLVYLFSLISPFFWETIRYRLKYCLKGPHVCFILDFALMS